MPKSPDLSYATTVELLDELVLRNALKTIQSTVEVDRLEHATRKSQKAYRLDLINKNIGALFTTLLEHKLFMYAEQAAGAKVKTSIIMTLVDPATLEAERAAMQAAARAANGVDYDA